MIAPAFLFAPGITAAPVASRPIYFFFLATAFGSGFNACGSKPM